MNKKLKQLSFMVSMIAILSITACSNKDSNTDLESQIQDSTEVLESNDKMESSNRVESVDSEKTTEITSSEVNNPDVIAPVKQKEVNIYSMDETSLDVVAAVGLVSEETVLTADIIVDMVVESFSDRLVSIGIDSVTTENDTVIVSFKKDQAPLYNSGSTLEGTILDAIAQSLVDNLKDYPKVIFRVEGNAYASGHFEFAMNEIYLDNTGEK